MLNFGHYEAKSYSKTEIPKDVVAAITVYQLLGFLPDSESFKIQIFASCMTALQFIGCYILFMMPILSSFGVIDMGKSIVQTYKGSVMFYSKILPLFPIHPQDALKLLNSF